MMSLLPTLTPLSAQLKVNRISDKLNLRNIYKNNIELVSHQEQGKSEKVQIRMSSGDSGDRSVGIQCL